MGENDSEQLMVNKQIDCIIPDNKSFDLQNYTFLLQINKNSLDLSDIREIADQKGFCEKDKFHITIIGFKNGNEIKKVLKQLSQTDQQKKLTEIQSVIEETNWKVTPKKDKFYITKEYKNLDEVVETRESFIQMVDIPTMEIFYENLNKTTGLNLETPPPHITLYTNGSDKEKSKMGIGINSKLELTQLNPKTIV